MDEQHLGIISKCMLYGWNNPSLSEVEAGFMEGILTK